MNVRFTVPLNNNLDDDASSVLNDSFIEENEFPDLDQSESSVVIAPIIEAVPTPSSKGETTPQPFNIATVPDTPVSLPKFPKLLTMDKLAKCSTFSGYPQDNAKMFLTEFESYALLHDLAEQDKRRIAAFHLHLKGPALTWYNSLSDESKQSWQNIYRHCNHGKRIISNLILFPGQSLEDYYNQILEKAQILQKPDQVVAKFISGLPDKMSFFVRAGQPVDIQSSLTAAKMAEACGYRQHDDVVNAIYKT
ncbi:unnamed protein product [Mytilus coruscus]|uniref:Retrotransposon gag domain-containing protein n=1 Tax=Mytilus coruscus TaxID=42192 RepID=A0A6J8DGE8_MYTCO|nr:unnamed protein product [Mytilus coruscus]